MAPPFQLVADGGVPADLLADGLDAMPTLIGTTRDEAWAFVPGAPADLTVSAVKAKRKSVNRRTRPPGSTRRRP